VGGLFKIVFGELWGCLFYFVVVECGIEIAVFCMIGD